MANATDAQAITQLQISNWRLTHSVVAQSLNPAEVASAWVQAITNQGDIGRVLICERDQILIGVAAIEFEGEVGLISLIEVAPEVRRQLIGARLLNAVADIARQGGCLQVSLWLNAEQTDGKAFFESMGWVPSGATRTVSAMVTVAHNSDARITEQQCEFTTMLEI